MLTALRDAIVASDEEPPSWFPWIDLFSDAFTRPRDELMRRAWEAFDRKPTWPADRWYMPGHLYLVGPNLCQRTTAELLATAECTNTHIAAMRHVAQIVRVPHVESPGANSSSPRSTSTDGPRTGPRPGAPRFRTYAPAIRATLSMAAGRFGEAARLFDEALHVQPLGEWHWSSYTLADSSARRAGPQRHTGRVTRSRGAMAGETEQWTCLRQFPSGAHHRIRARPPRRIRTGRRLQATPRNHATRRARRRTPPQCASPTTTSSRPPTGEPQPLDDLLARLDEFAERINDQRTN